MQHAQSLLPIKPLLSFKNNLKLKLVATGRDSNVKPFKLCLSRLAS